MGNDGGSIETLAVDKERERTGNDVSEEDDDGLYRLTEDEDEEEEDDVAEMASSSSTLGTVSRSSCAIVRHDELRAVSSNTRVNKRP